MASPAERFHNTTAVRLSSGCRCGCPPILSPVPATAGARTAGKPPPPRCVPAGVQAYDGGPVEFERVVPPSGDMEVTGRQFWLGPRPLRQVIRWADTGVIHLTTGGLRIKSVRSHLSTPAWPLAATGARRGGPPPLPRPPGAAIEVERVVSKDGQSHLAGRYVIAAEIPAAAGPVSASRKTRYVFDPQTRELLRTRPSPLTWDQACTIRGASPAGPAPRPSAVSVTVQRRAATRRDHGRAAERSPWAHPRRAGEPPPTSPTTP